MNFKMWKMKVQNWVLSLSCARSSHTPDLKFSIFPNVRSFGALPKSGDLFEIRNNRNQNQNQNRTAESLEDGRENQSTYYEDIRREQS